MLLVTLVFFHLEVDGWMEDFLKLISMNKGLSYWESFVG